MKLLYSLYLLLTVIHFFNSKRFFFLFFLLNNSLNLYGMRLSPFFPQTFSILYNHYAETFFYCDAFEAPSSPSPLVKAASPIPSVLATPPPGMLSAGEAVVNSEIIHCLCYRPSAAVRSFHLAAHSLHGMNWFHFVCLWQPCLLCNEMWCGEGLTVSINAGQSADCRGQMKVFISSGA